MLVGAGNSDSKNLKANHTSVKNELALFWEIYPRLGINIATKKYLLYLNINIIGEGDIALESTDKMATPMRYFLLG